MSVTVIWFAFAALLICDMTLIYFFAVRYLRDKACLNLAAAVLPEYAVSWLSAAALYAIPFSSELKWLPLIAAVLHAFDNALIISRFMIGLPRSLKADSEKSVFIRTPLRTCEIKYTEGHYASYKKQLYLALFLKVTVFFSSLLTICYALSSFVYFGIIH